MKYRLILKKILILKIFLRPILNFIQLFNNQLANPYYLTIFAIRFGIWNFKNWNLQLLLYFRDVAQPGSVHVWGAWGRKFKSCHPDQVKHHLTLKPCKSY